MVKILFLKFHESAHSKFELGIKFDSSPRYLLNIELDQLDTQYDLITEYKRGYELLKSEKKGVNIGEEGYAIEMFIYDSVVKTDFLLKLLINLNEFNNVDLYIGNNFKDLNAIFDNLIHDQIKYNVYQKKEEQMKKIKARSIQTKINSYFEDTEEIKKTPIYFFNTFPLEANY